MRHARWQRLSARGRVVLGVLVTLPFVILAVIYVVTADGISVFEGDPGPYAYLWVFTLIALDAVMPIFPGETTLNAAATVAAQGKLEVAPIIVMGALGAIVGDSCLFWLARRYARKFDGQVKRARANKNVQQAFELLDASPAVLIIGGRYVPGMRFVVNATMGLSDIRYRRFVSWSIVSGILWSSYTTILAYQIGLSLGEYPLASFVISGLVTTVVLTVVFFTVRRHRRRSVSTQPAGDDAAGRPGSSGIP